MLIFAVVPILFYWTGANIQELGPSLMYRSLFVFALGGLAYYLIWYFALKRDKYKASILAVLAVIVSYNYGSIFTLYDKLANGQIASHGYFIPLLILLYAGAAYLVIKKLKYSKDVRNYLAILATVLLVFNMYTLVKYWTTNSGLANKPYGPEVKAAKETKSRPDIYYLIFDRYANQRTLKKIYNYDNTPFLKSLAGKGFYVADSTANYPFTTQSLTSSLNMTYIPEEYHNRPDNGLFYTLLKDKMENNKVALFLKSQGYKFANIGPWWTATKYNKNADYDLYLPAGLVFMGKPVDLREHELHLFENTLFYQLFKKRVQIDGRRLFSLTFPSGGESSGRVIHRDSIHHQFKALEEISRKNERKFVFAHFLFPHDPYVLDAKCNKFRQPYKDEYVVYLNQLKCTNQKIQNTVDVILKNSKQPPIIIIQSDEGPYPKEFRANRDQFNWSKAEPRLLAQKAGILNAYYFPDKNYAKLYKNITPVNSFRLIFNQYFGAELELLPDRHWFPESEHRRFYLHDMTGKF